MTQGKGPSPRLTRLAAGLLALAAIIVVALAVGSTGCGGGSRFVGRNDRPGTAAGTYWTWAGFDLAGALEPAPPRHPRWSEFLDAAAKHRVLAYDFQYLEGHPSAVDPAWKDSAPPALAEKGFVEYRPAGGWHAVDDHFGPAGAVVCYVRLPPGSRIDTSDNEAWRLPVGTELVQLLYRDKDSLGRKEPPVEWRRMRHAGTERGQMRSDGSRGDWIYESAIRDPAKRQWRRTREDGRDAVWTRLGGRGGGLLWPAVRPHTCAACHALAGDSPLDGPRGGHEVYSLGDLREAVWSGQLERFQGSMSSRPVPSAVAALAAEPRPPEPAERFAAYVAALARERNQAAVVAGVQQMNLAQSPFSPGDPRARERGREVYLTQCAGCHGAEARGRGRLALSDPPPPALVGVRAGKLLATMREGDGAMPAWNGLLPGDDQWRIIEYLKGLK